MSESFNSPSLENRTYLITGGARRLGREMALAIARSKGNLIIHYNSSTREAETLKNLILGLGSQAWLVKADLSSEKGLRNLCEEAFSLTHVSGLINSASIFLNKSFKETTLEIWQEHIQVNLTAPFLLSRFFAKQMGALPSGQIVNLVDWRATRPGSDHFAYTVSKAALVAMTKSLALSLSPGISVNAIALGAILPPENENINEGILEKVPVKRWAYIEELENVLIYLLSNPRSLTGQIIHLDGGRHLIY
jgi:NAD(P)-dependent dehydrogenase (short-subunit alcohol dehydrogenase family)